MTTKEYLSQIRKYDNMIQNKLKEIYNLRLLASGTTAISDGDRVQTSNSKDKISGFVAMIVDLEHEVDDIIDKRLLIIKQIESIQNSDFYDILAKRYILGSSLKEIGIEKDMSNAGVGKICSKALETFEMMYGNIYMHK